MSPTQMSASPSIQELLTSAQQLNMRDLKTFSQQVSLFYAQRKSPHLSKREAELLQKINRGLPEELWQPYRQLLIKLHDENLTPEEHKMLIHISNQIEEINAERIGYLVELAQLREQPLPKVMDDLGIYPLSHE